MHVYYSSCWAPSKSSYNKLDKLLQDFIWPSDTKKHGFHRDSQDFFYLPKYSSSLGLISTQKKEKPCVSNGLYSFFFRKRGLEKFSLGTTFTLGFLYTAHLGRGLPFKPFFSCKNQCKSRVLLLLKESSTPRRKPNHGFVGIELDFEMVYLSINMLFSFTSVAFRPLETIFSWPTMSSQTWEDLQVQVRLTLQDRQTFDLLISIFLVEFSHKTDKVAIKVAHLQELLQYCSNAPHMVSREPLNGYVTGIHSPSHNHFRGCNSSTKHSHTLHS